MTQAIDTKLRLTGIAGTLALAMTLFAAPASFAGERGDRWERDRSPRIERHYNRDRQMNRGHRRAQRIERHYRMRRAERRAHRRTERRVHRRAEGYNSHRGHRRGHGHGRHYGHRRGHSLGPVVAGIGLGILTYAIIDSHRGH
jgi:hypothetical protein